MINKIIVSPGEYKTRNGKRVTIREVYSNVSGRVYGRGSVWRTYRGQTRPGQYEVWSESGRYKTMGESPLDIVGRW